jgi:hypothetical protein
MRPPRGMGTLSAVSDRTSASGDVRSVSSSRPRIVWQKLQAPKFLACKMDLSDTQSAQPLLTEG